VHNHQRPLRHHSRIRDRHRGREPRRLQPSRGEDRRNQQEGQHGPGPVRGPGEAQRLRERRLRDRPRRPGLPPAAAVAAEHPAQARHRRGLDPHRLYLQMKEGLLHPRRGALLHQPPAGGRHAGPQRRRARPQRMPSTSRGPQGVHEARRVPGLQVEWLHRGRRRRVEDHLPHGLPPRRRWSRWAPAAAAHTL